VVKVNNLQDFVSLVGPITALLLALTALLDLVSKGQKPLAALWPGIRRGTWYLLLVASQVLPVGGVIWYFMYFAAMNPDRLTEKAFFLLLVTYPTVLIILFEVFWGIGFYPRLLSNSKPIEPWANNPKAKTDYPHHNKRN